LNSNLITAAAIVKRHVGRQKRVGKPSARSAPRGLCGYFQGIASGSEPKLS